MSESEFASGAQAVKPLTARATAARNRIILGRGGSGNLKIFGRICKPCFPATVSRYSKKS